MALNKQRILSELGSVMNQLQSADCGCMGKLFNSGQENTPVGSPLPTCSGCRHGCCRGHGCGAYYNNMGMGAGGGMGPGNSMAAGGGMGMAAAGRMGMDVGGGMSAGMNQDYMGMNAGGMPISGGGVGMPNNKFNMMNSLKDTTPRLYSETYNYLNQNLMRPAIEEVYQDLKSLSPVNAIGNSPLSQQIPGLSGSGQNPVPSGAAGTGPGENQGMFTGAMGNTMDHNAAYGEPMKSMGNEILNMMTSRHNTNANQCTTAGGMQGGIGAPQSPYGQVGVTPYSPSKGANENQNTNNPAANMGMGNLQMANPTTHYVTQDNMYSLPPETNVNNAQANIMNGNINPGIQTSNPPTVTAANVGLTNSGQGIRPNNYGPHSLGMKTFQKMFPGIAEGDDLGFDPMAIAIQMNPANQKKTAMDNINRMINNHPSIRSNIMQPGIQGTNAISSQLAQQQQQLNAPAGQQNLTTNQLPIHDSVSGQKGLPPTGLPGDQQIVQGQQPVALPQNQQIYTALTGSPTMNQPIQQQQIPRQVQPQQVQGQAQSRQLQGQTEYQHWQTFGQADYKQQDPALYQQGQIPLQQSIDPATGAPLNYIADRDPNARVHNQGTVKETLNPMNTLRNTSAYAQPEYATNYNTLGQPINLQPVEKYNTRIPPLPQTLSPQDSKLYGLESSVKNTMSKTSLAANRVIGQAPSKSQLRHIYRQYKAGHAGMQQSIRPPHGGSQSDGKLYPPGGANAQITYVQGQAPIEKVGGDTVQNVNSIQQPMSAKHEQNFGQIGDVAQINKPQTDVVADKGALMQSNGNNRNGLQDMRFSKYIHSNGWSFHGY